MILPPGRPLEPISEDECIAASSIAYFATEQPKCGANVTRDKASEPTSHPC